MNIEEIHLQINGFIAKYFSDAYEVVECELLFMEENGLYHSNVNYVELYEYVQTAIVNFKMKDEELLNPLLLKLYDDVNSSLDYVAKIEKNSATPAAIFKGHFLQNFVGYQKMKKNFIEAKESRNISKVKIYKNEIEQINMIYKDYFLQHFSREKSYIVDSLYLVINSKIYYLNRLLWLRINDSELLQHYFESIELKNIHNLKSYIQYRMKNKLSANNSMDKVVKNLQKLGQEYG